MIAPEVGGYVDAVLVNDNQQVIKGQVLVVIDSRDYQAALAGAQADIAAANAAILSDNAQVFLQAAKFPRPRRR